MVSITTEEVEEHSRSILGLLNACWYIKILPDLGGNKINVSLWLSDEALRDTFASAYVGSAANALRIFGATDISQLDLEPSQFSEEFNLQFSINEKTDPRLLQLIDHSIDTGRQATGYAARAKKSYVEEQMKRLGYAVEEYKHIGKTSYLMTQHQPPEPFSKDDNFVTHITSYLKHARDENLWQLVAPYGQKNRQLIGIKLADVQRITGWEESITLPEAHQRFYEHALHMLGIDCERISDKSAFDGTPLSEHNEYLVISSKQALEKATERGIIDPKLAARANYESTSPHVTEHDGADDLTARCYNNLNQAIGQYANNHPKDNTAKFLQEYFQGTQLGFDLEHRKSSVQRIEQLAKVVLAYQGQEMDETLINSSAFAKTLQHLIHNHSSEDVAHSEQEAASRNRREFCEIMTKAAVGAVVAYKVREIATQDTKATEKKEFVAKCMMLANTSKRLKLPDSIMEKQFASLYDELSKINPKAEFAAQLGANATVGALDDQSLINGGAAAESYVRWLAEYLSPRIDAIVSWNKQLVQTESGFVELQDQHENAAGNSQDSTNGATKLGYNNAHIENLKRMVKERPNKEEGRRI